LKKKRIKKKRKEKIQAAVTGKHLSPKLRSGAVDQVQHDRNPSAMESLTQSRTL